MLARWKGDGAKRLPSLSSSARVVPWLTKKELHLLCSTLAMYVESLDWEPHFNKAAPGLWWTQS